MAKLINKMTHPASSPSAMGENGPELPGEGQEGTLLAERKPQVKRPPFYKVILLNDDYTPMEFVVKVLENIFNKDHTEAVSIMMDVHNKGAGLCGIYTKDVAETKIDQALYLARQHEHPLQCSMEQE